MEDLKVLFFGLGSIGKRHAIILNKYYNATLYAVRTNKGQETHNLPITEFFNIDDAMKMEPDICFITNPTSFHIPTALECVKHDTPIFMEKPISHTYDNVDKLGEEIDKRNLLVYVAYNMRFHPVIEHLKQIISSDEDKPVYFRVICSSYLPSWRPNQNYEISYSAKKEMGGGVIFDVSHEIDYINWLFGDIQDISGYYDKISNLKINSEDIAEIQLKCNDICGSLHLNYFSHLNERKIQIYYNTKYIEGDLLNNKIITYKNGSVHKFKWILGDREGTFIKQMEFFLEQYKLNNIHLMNNYKEASKVFKKMVEFKEDNEYYISR